MKHLTTLLISYCLICSSCKQQQSLSKVTQEPSKKETLHEKLDTYFGTLTEHEKFNGVIYVAQNGKEVMHKAFNLRNDPKNSLYVTTENQFDIHSVSKLMFHYLFLQLEQENKLNRQNKLSQYFPDFPKGDQITLDMLLNHNSGLPRELSDFEGEINDLDIAQMLEKIKQEPLIFEPGEDLQYSNLAYQLLYYIMGQVNEQTFEQYLLEELFQPLEMNHSGAHFHIEENRLKNLAANHELEEDTFVRVDNVLEDEFRQSRFFSTSSDLALLLDKFQNDSLATKMAKDNVVGHSGGSDGIRAHIYANLKTKDNFVLLCNIDAIPFNKVLEDMVSMMEGKPYELPQKLNRQAISLPSSTLEKYKGKYVFRDMNIALFIEVEPNHLLLFQDGEQIATLAAETEYIFFADPEEAASFEFITNEQGTYDVLMDWRGVRLKGVRE